MDAAVVAFVVVIYANLVVLGGRMLGSPVVGGAILAAAALALIAVPVLFQILVRRRGLVLDKPLLLMLGFLGTLCISTFIARDPRTAGAWLGTYLIEGLLVYFLVINAVRSLRTLRRTVWGLLVVGAILASLGAYQEISHDYQHQFGGLAQRDLARGFGVEVQSGGKLIPTRERVGIANRAAGPIADPNRWAQFLLVILPLAVLRVKDEKSKPLRFAAVVCTLLILGGIFLTYSRGGLFALAIVVVCMLGFRALRWWHVVPAAIFAMVLAVIIAPGVLERMKTISDVPGLIADRAVSQSDGAVRGRLTEMLAAWHVFLDHPLLGVGPGHYSTYYSMDYMQDPDIAFRRINRPRHAHSLYLELAAETGLLGVAVFTALVVVVLWRLDSVRRRALATRPDLAPWAVGFWVAIVAYLAAGFFLQLSFQRYFWLFLALAGATVQVLESRLQQAPGAIEERYS
jgi:putative inorganic carbon (HCO3(-)) transporter